MIHGFCISNKIKYILKLDGQWSMLFHKTRYSYLRSTSTFPSLLWLAVISSDDSSTCLVLFDQIEYFYEYLLKLILQFFSVFAEIFLWWEIDIWAWCIVSVSLHMSYWCSCSCFLHKDIVEDPWCGTTWERSLVSCITWWSRPHYCGEFWFVWTKISPVLMIIIHGLNEHRWS